MSEFQVQLEVAGPAAMFTRPDTGATPISYPVPTWSAAKGMFDAVAWRPHVQIHPTRVEIYSPIRYERYVTNYGGPLRNAKDINRATNYQFKATILVDVCYRLIGEVRDKKNSTWKKGQRRPRRRRGKDWKPLLKKRFDDRLTSGITFYTPCLGWKEFVPTYFGPVRMSVGDPERTGEIHIPSMLISMWQHREFKPQFAERWIVDGVMSYESERPV